MNATLIELPAFTRYRADYLDDEHFRGLRKLRHGHPRRGGAMIKRNLFSEINEGFDALAGARTGKQTLRTHEVETNPAPEVNAAELKALRERLNLSCPVFATTCALTHALWRIGSRAGLNPTPKQPS